MNILGYITVSIEDLIDYFCSQGCINSSPLSIGV